MSSVRLSGAETALLTSETRNRPMHIGTLAVFAPAPSGSLTYDKVKQLVSERLDLVPAFRRRVVEVPLGLDRPYAVDDEELDLEFHVRQIAVPPPATREELADIVSRLHARPLDRSRPLWELYVIEGLEGDEVGLYAKVHFVALDPTKGTEIITALLDSDPDAPAPEPVERRPPAAPPTPLEMVTRAGMSFVRRPGRLIRMQREMAERAWRSTAQQIPIARNVMMETLKRTQGVGDLLTGTRRPEDEYLTRPALRAPRVSWNQRITPHRRIAFASLPFDDVHAIKTAAGTTVHDVVMAVCAGGLRSWLDAHTELPTEPLLANVPVLVRSEREGGADHVAQMLAVLPTNEPDPRKRLEIAHQSMRLAKESRAVPASLQQDMTRYAPPAIAGLAARLVGAISVEDIGAPPFNVTISNVPGPRHAVYCGGARQVANYPLSVITNGVGLHIALVTYDDKLHLGLVACREAMPDLWLLADDLVDALDELRAAVVGPPN